MLTSLVDSVLALVPPHHQKTAKQFIKFGITGTIGAIVDFGTFAFLTRVLDFNSTYTVLGTEVIVANNISVFLAVCSNFIINRTWTFQDTDGNATKQGIGYFALNTFTWALNQILVAFFFALPLFITLFNENRDFAAKVCAIIIVLFINFFGSKLFIFRHAKAD